MTMEPTRKPVKINSIRTPNGVEMVYANNLYCNYCPMFFATFAGKRRHEMSHEGRRPYSCEECHVSYYRQERLSNHKKLCRVISALGEDIKWCSFCDHFFRTNDGLRKHYVNYHGMMHYPISPLHKKASVPKDIPSTGPRVFSCDLCAVGFPTTFALGRHRYSAHGVKGKVDISSSNIGGSKVEKAVDSGIEQIQIREPRVILTRIVVDSKDQPFLGFP